MMRRLFLITLVVITPIFSATTQAEIYKWTDADGTVHYSERKPETGTEFRTMNPKNINATAERQSVAERDAEFVKRKQAEEEQAKKDRETAEAAAKQQQACEEAQKRLTSLQRPRINEVGEDGSRTRMGEEWRQEQIEQARAAIADLCK